MAYQAIVTKYFGATNTRGSYIKASAQAGNVTLEYDDALNANENHAAAAQKLALKFKWKGHWFSGGLPGGHSNVFVCTRVDIGEQPDFVTPGE